MDEWYPRLADAVMTPVLGDLTPEHREEFDRELTRLVRRLATPLRALRPELRPAQADLLVNAGLPQVIEICNNGCMQYNAYGDGPHITPELEEFGTWADWPGRWGNSRGVLWWLPITALRPPAARWTAAPTATPSAASSTSA